MQSQLQKRNASIYMPYSGVDREELHLIRLHLSHPSRKFCDPAGWNITCLFMLRNSGGWIACIKPCNIRQSYWSLEFRLSNN